MGERGGLPWYCIWTDFSGHPKTHVLCDAVRDENAGMYVIRLLEHCADHALDGVVLAASVERVCQWRKKRGTLLAALTVAGFIEQLPDGKVRVHGWLERNGARIRKWLTDNAKPRGNKAPSLAGPSLVPHGTGEGREGDESGTSAGSAGVDGIREKKKNQKHAAAGGAIAPPRQPSSDPGVGEPEVTPPPPAAAPGAGVSPEPAPVKLALASPPGDDRPTRPLQVHDLVELGRLGAEYRARVQLELGHGLALAAAGDERRVRDELEGLLEAHERARPGAVDRAVDWTVATVRARRGGAAPGSVAYCLRLLGDMPAPEADPRARVRAECTAWADMLDAVERLPPAERLRSDTVARWLLPLRASLLRGELLLEAPTADHAAFVSEQYLAGLRRLAAEVVAPHVVVTLVSPPSVAAGGA